MTRILFRGGRVHTPSDPHATALGVADGKVAWTGDEDTAGHYADNAERVVQLEGRLVTPAFVDAHVHLAQTGLAAQSLDLSTAATKQSALDSLAAYARVSTFPLVLGFGWQETQWPEQRAFTREEVDRAVGGRPAYLSRIEQHSAVLSSAFLDACPEVAKASGYEANGRVERDAHHAARSGLFRLLPRTAREDAILEAMSLAAGQGIGMVHELGAPHISPAEDFDIIGSLSQAAAVAERPAIPEVEWYWGSRDVDVARAIGCTGAAGDLCVDGAIGSRTAALRAPYADDAGSGHLYLDAGAVREHVVVCTRAGVQAGFHCIGDRAIGEVVDGFRQAAEVVGADALRRTRHRLEHLEMAGPDDLRVLGRLGVTASVQPVFDQLWGGSDSLYARRLGPERARPMNAYASMSRAGIALAFGSDTPVTSFGPWAAVRAAAWHHTENERMSVPAAFDAHTRGGWRAARRDDGGVLVGGAPASLAVWEVPGHLEAGLPDLTPGMALPRCTMTMVRGQVAFEEAGVLR